MKGKNFTFWEQKIWLKKQDERQDKDGKEYDRDTPPPVLPPIVFNVELKNHVWLDQRFWANIWNIWCMCI